MLRTGSLADSTWRNRALATHRCRAGAALRRPAPLSIGLAAALMLTACGVASKDTASNAPASSAASCKTIKIGAPNPLSGPLAEFGTNSVNGMELAAKQINDAGGISSLDGAKVQIVKADTSSDNPAQASTATTRLATSEHVVAMVGAWLGNLSLTATTAAEQARVPIVTQSWTDELTQRGYQYTFQVNAPSSAIGADLVKYYVEAAKAAGRPSSGTVVTVAPNDVSNVAQTSAAVKAFLAAGYTALTPQYYQAGLTDVAAIVNRVAGEHPDLLLLSGSPSDAPLIVKGLRDRGVNAPIIGFGGAFIARQLKDSLGAQSQGIMSMSTWNQDLNLPGVADAAAAYRSQFAAPFMPLEAGVTWVDTWLIADAVKKAGSCDPQKIRDALANSDETSGPASAIPGGVVAFDKSGANTKTHPIMIQWQGGVPRTVWPKEDATVKIILN